MTGTRLISYEDSLTMPESTFEEIVNGELRIMPPPSFKHQKLISVLDRQFQFQLDDAATLVLQNYGQAIRFEPTFTYRLPDLAIFQTAGLLQKDGYYVISAPSLLVEVLSPSNRKGNVQELLSDYASIGTPEVWLIESEKRVLKALTLRDSVLRETRIVRAGSVSPIEHPHVSIDVQRLWDALD